MTLPDICKSYQLWVDISIGITATVWYFRQMCKSALQHMYQLTGTVQAVQYWSWYRSQNSSSVHSFTSLLTVHDMFDTSSSRWYPRIQLVQYRRFDTYHQQMGLSICLSGLQSFRMRRSICNSYKPRRKTNLTKSRDSAYNK